MAERDDRHVDADEARDVGRVDAARGDHDLGLDRRPCRSRPRRRARCAADAGHAGARLELGAEAAGAVGEREGQLARVEVAVLRQEGGGAHALGAHQREELLRLLRRHDLQRRARTSWPRRPGGGSPRRARACTRAAGRRARASPDPCRSPARAPRRARRSTASSASARGSSAAARRARPSARSSRA